MMSVDKLVDFLGFADAFAGDFTKFFAGVFGVFAVAILKPVSVKLIHRIMNHGGLDVK